MTEHTDALAADAACSLSPGRVVGRIGAWRSLAAHALHREIGEGQVRATYPNRPEIAKRLAQLIEAEKDCCPFLHFDVQEVGTVLQVQLRYPPEFAPLLAAAAGRDPTPP